MHEGVSSDILRLYAAGGFKGRLVSHVVTGPGDVRSSNIIPSGCIYYNLCEFAVSSSENWQARD